MGPLENFIGLGLQCVSVAFHLLPYSLLLIALWIAAYICVKPSDTISRTRILLNSLITALAIPSVILLVGAFQWVEPLSQPLNQRITAAEQIIIVLFLLNFPLALFFTWRAKVVWPVTLTSWILSVYLSALASFLSPMAVTGKWL